MRRFRLDSASAKEADRLQSRAFNWKYDRGSDLARAMRASALLLHWWAVGHDPRRALNRCSYCLGSGVEAGTFATVDTCADCGGTGRRKL
jgi:hypothetical protein